MPGGDHGSRVASANPKKDERDKKKSHGHGDGDKKKHKDKKDDKKKDKDDKHKHKDKDKDKKKDTGTLSKPLVDKKKATKPKREQRILEEPPKNIDLMTRPEEILELLKSPYDQQVSLTLRQIVGVYAAETVTLTTRKRIATKEIFQQLTNLLNDRAQRLEEVDATEQEWAEAYNETRVICAITNVLLATNAPGVKLAIEEKFAEADLMLCRTLLRLTIQAEDEGKTGAQVPIVQPQHVQPLQAMASIGSVEQREELYALGALQVLLQVCGESELFRTIMAINGAVPAITPSDAQAAALGSDGQEREATFQVSNDTILCSLRAVHNILLAGVNASNKRSDAPTAPEKPIPGQDDEEETDIPTSMAPHPYFKELIEKKTLEHRDRIHFPPPQTFMVVLSTFFTGPHQPGSSPTPPPMPISVSPNPSQSPDVSGQSFQAQQAGIVPQAVRHRSALCLACIHKGHPLPTRLRPVVQFLKRHITNKNEAVATGALGALSNVAVAGGNHSVLKNEQCLRSINDILSSKESSEGRLLLSIRFFLDLDLQANYDTRLELHGILTEQRSQLGSNGAPGLGGQAPESMLQSAEYALGEIIRNKKESSMLHKKASELLKVLRDGPGKIGDREVDVDAGGETGGRDGDEWVNIAALKADENQGYALVISYSDKDASTLKVGLKGKDDDKGKDKHHKDKKDKHKDDKKDKKDKHHHKDKAGKTEGKDDKKKHHKDKGGKDDKKDKHHHKDKEGGDKKDKKDHKKKDHDKKKDKKAK